MSSPVLMRSDIVTEPVHILFVIDQLCEVGGAERVLLNTIRLLPKEQFRCSLITFKIDLSFDLFQSLPCPHVVYPIHRTYDFSGLRALSAMRQYLKQENVQIIHTFHETSDLWAGPICKLFRRCALVSSRRDMGILRTLKHDIAYRALHSMFDLVLTVSDQVRQFCIKEDGLSPQKVATLYNGLEVRNLTVRKGFSDLRRQLAISSTAPLVVTVGNIRPVKGIDVLVETAAIVVRHYPDSVFLVVGRKSDKKYVEDLEARVTQLGIQRNVRFWGESDDVPSLLRSCDVFFLPSRSEGFSNALIEAMACGLPCVASRVGGNDEAIEEGRSGYLVGCENAIDAAERILRLLGNPTFAKQMGNRGRKIVESKFTAEIMIQQLIGHYERLLAARRN